MTPWAGWPSLPSTFPLMDADCEYAGEATRIAIARKGTTLKKRFIGNPPEGLSILSLIFRCALPGLHSQPLIDFARIPVAFGRRWDPPRQPPEKLLTSERNY